MALLSTLVLLWLLLLLQLLQLLCAVLLLLLLLLLGMDSFRRALRRALWLRLVLLLGLCGGRDKHAVLSQVLC
jgi:hypothetical protein